MAAYAGFWRRFGAAFIDGLIVGVPSFVVYLVAFAASDQPFTTTSGQYGSGYSTTTTMSPELQTAQLAGWVLTLIVAYFVIMRPIAITGRTIGGRALSIRVVDSTTGQPIGHGRSIGRYLFAIISGCVCYLGYFWMLFSDRNQTWHDMVTSSIVITE